MKTTCNIGTEKFDNYDLFLVFRDVYSFQFHFAMISDHKMTLTCLFSEFHCYDSPQMQRVSVHVDGQTRNKSCMSLYIAVDLELV